jgi:hypothetical protein
MHIDTPKRMRPPMAGAQPTCRAGSGLGVASEGASAVFFHPSAGRSLNRDTAAALLIMGAAEVMWSHRKVCSFNLELGVTSNGNEESCQEAGCQEEGPG